MFTAHARRLEAIRAQRLLDQIQVRAVPHMEQQARRSFIDALVSACRGAVAEAADAAERVVWNGTVLRTTGAIKRMAHKMMAPGAVA